MGIITREESMPKTLIEYFETEPNWGRMSNYTEKEYHNTVKLAISILRELTPSQDTDTMCARYGTLMYLWGKAQSNESQISVLLLAYLTITKCKTFKGASSREYVQDIINKPNIPAKASALSIIADTKYPEKKPKEQLRKLYQEMGIAAQ